MRSRGSGHYTKPFSTHGSSARGVVKGWRLDFAGFAKLLQVQYLHCLLPAEDGGENVFSDAIQACRVLRERFPEHYQTLSTIKVQYEDIINDNDPKRHPAFLISSKTVIK